MTRSPRRLLFAETSSLVTQCGDDNCMTGRHIVARGRRALHRNKRVVASLSPHISSIRPISRQRNLAGRATQQPRPAQPRTRSLLEGTADERISCPEHAKIEPRCRNPSRKIGLWSGCFSDYRCCQIWNVRTAAMWSKPSKVDRIVLCWGFSNVLVGR